MTHSRTWKKAEQRIAALFGTRRRRGSGSDPETGGDDVLHPRLHVEIKYRQSHGPVNTYEKHVRPKAHQERKMPVLVLVSKHSGGHRPPPMAVVPLDTKYLRKLADELEIGEEEGICFPHVWTEKNVCTYCGIEKPI